MKTKLIAILEGIGILSAFLYVLSMLLYYSIAPFANHQLGSFSDIPWFNLLIEIGITGVLWVIFHFVRFPTWIIMRNYAIYDIAGGFTIMLLAWPQSHLPGVFLIGFVPVGLLLIAGALRIIWGMSTSVFERKEPQLEDLEDSEA